MNKNVRRKKENNYAFIDSQNLYLSITNQGWELDYKKFRQYLREKYRVEKAFMFIGYMKENEAMYASLKNMGYIMTFKETLIRPDGKAKGNVDAELVLQAMVDYKKYDKAVIISGDGDFCCLIKYLVEHNKLLKLLIPNKKRYSSLLRKFNKHISFISDQKNKLEYNKKKTGH